MRIASDILRIGLSTLRLYVLSCIVSGCLGVMTVTIGGTGNVPKSIVQWMLKHPRGSVNRVITFVSFVCGHF